MILATFLEYGWGRDYTCASAGVVAVASYVNTVVLNYMLV